MLTLIARVTGGLGNQMFQYAATWAIAQQQNAKVAVDISCYDYTHEPNRQYMLDRFAVNAPVLTRGPVSRFLYKLAGAERPGLAVPAALARGVLRIRDVREPQEYAYVPPTLPARGRVRLMGYWQSPKYFEAFADALRAQFQLRAAPTGRNLELLEQIRGSACPVSLHVRRGDYLTTRPGAVLSLDYYARAMHLLEQRLPAITYFIFSDDVAWAMQHLPLKRPAVAVDANGELTAEHDLRLMAACRHHIIANSSFSWWGAWLNPSADKQVISPKFWMGTQQSHYPDLYPVGWHIIDQFETPAGEAARP